MLGYPLASYIILKILFYVSSSIEASAKHEAKRTEQAAKGLLERQKLLNEKVQSSAVLLLVT